MRAAARFALAGLLLGTLMWSASIVSNQQIVLDFDQDGVLPSGQGMSYSSPLPIPEGSAFSVSNGLLHLHTLGWNQPALYEFENAFNPALGFRLEFRVQVFPGTSPWGMDFAVGDDSQSIEVALTDGGIISPADRRTLIETFIPFDTTSGFHTYTVVSPGGPNYALYVDGILLASGEAGHGQPNRRLAFGDGTYFYDGFADIDYVHYQQVPEGATVWLAGLGVSAIAVWRFRLSRGLVRGYGVRAATQGAVVVNAAPSSSLPACM